MGSPPQPPFMPWSGCSALHGVSLNLKNVVFITQSPRSWNFLKFHDFIGFIYDSGKNEVLLVKIRVRVADLWCDSLWKKTQKPRMNVTALGSKSFFMSSPRKFCMKQILIFKFCIIFDKDMSVFFPENCKKPIKICWSHSRYVSSLSS